MIRGWPAWILVLLGAVAVAAEDEEQLDADFLEYLANLEGDDDDWTLVAQAEEVPKPPWNEAERKTPQPSKQADRPAVDEP